jgi:chromosomal replication initiator protein
MTPLTALEKQKIFTFLESRLEPKIYDAWCRSLEIEASGENAVRIPTANPFHRDWLEKLLRKPLEDAFQDLFGREVEVVFQVGGAPLLLSPPPAPAPLPPPGAAAPAPVPIRAFKAEYTFANFVEGPSNRMAHAAAVAVSESPAGLYNPLFLHGGVGLGKTHLLQAICQAILARNPAATVLYLSCEDFVNGYISAIQKNRLDAFRARYRNADVLVVDDIHFLSEKEGSQEEFFHTFNALHLAGRQMVLSSDQPAEDIPALKQHLLSRFKSGFDAPLLPPTYEMRLAILRRKSTARGWDLPEEVLGHIASQVQTNIRELEGALTKVMGFASLAKRKPDLDIAREVLRNSRPPRATSVSVSEVQHLVAKYFNKRVSELQSKRWTKSTSLARQVCIYLCHRFTGSSLQELGAHFGGRDHTTILYSIRKIEDAALRNNALQADLERLTRQITES